MGRQAEAYLRKAEHCEKAGRLAVTLEARLMYADLAQQWRDFAKKIELLEQQKAGDEGR
jgi:hypothetical protein